jgi:hypothetical protein
MTEKKTKGIARKSQTQNNEPLTIPHNWTDFPEELRLRLGTYVGRQRFMSTPENHCLIVAHYVPDADEVGRRGILFWRDPSGEWRASNGDPGKLALGMHLDRYQKRIEACDQLEAAAERADDYLPVLESLAPITRSARNLFQTLDEARKAIPLDRSLIDHRDRAYEISRTADLLYEDSKNSLEVAMVRKADEQAKASHRMAVASHRLNIFAALFFPFATLGAIFGTTLTDNWSWSRSAAPFILYLGSCLVIGVILTFFVVGRGNSQGSGERGGDFPA